MKMSERNMEIYKLREEGCTYTYLASKYQISSSRVRDIYRFNLARKQDEETAPPLKKMLPGRLQKALVAWFNDQDIFAKPDKIMSIPLSRLKWAPMIGKVSIKELTDAMLVLGYVKADDPWLNVR